MSTPLLTHEQLEWIELNRAAIDEYNEVVLNYGMLSEDLRTF